MSAVSLFCLVFAYFALLLLVAWRTSRNATNDSFFIGNKRSNWMLVAFGMVGTTLSGVTFVSVPGAIGRDGFGYLQVILGYVLGYIAVAYILLPLYYRLKLTSIYTYLEQRLGPSSYRSGAAFFILSRTLSASARLYLVVNILQAAILDSLGVPFWLTTLAILAMILMYTYQGGVKTIVWTDMLQTAGMLLGLAVCAGWLLGQMHLSLPDSLAAMDARGLTHVVTTSIDSPAYFWKQVLAGFFIVLAMTGMDQEIMQKNISVQTLRDSQKNMLLLTVVLTGVLLLFMFLGGLLHLYAPTVGLAASGDKLFPAVVMQHMPAAVQLVFFIGLVSALFPSADGAMTALTSSFCIDILGMQRRTDLPEAAKVRLRHRVHLAFCAIFLLLVLLFKWVGNASMIGLVLKLTGYTYGPLLGLFAFGILTRRAVRDRWVPLVALAGPVLCYVIDSNQKLLFGSYRLGLELLIMNGLLVFAGLLLISKPRQ
ncbi:sodium:solute symporter [Duganella sp. BJB488]|uniref:sodium:solute symporter n=1 Tax=unclassified Duganella TaxID=2636909 RepID=UPI000E34F174|nr:MULTISPECIES: sodium:solute symporter [unclassified Duganella]RFP20331.1 sodium:solute symporter [Duganella sp. BJB489]RFP21223.1 sodium:solute symporter [Duganella sp. BJB488]RFP33365.1 sodium:solute symporter [Duganella sp. BJB480]